MSDLDDRLVTKLANANVRTCHTLIVRVFISTVSRYRHFYDTDTGEGTAVVESFEHKV